MNAEAFFPSPLTRRAVLAVSAGLAAGLAAGPALAAYPERPVKVLVGVVPGAATDSVARLLAIHLGNRLGKPFVVENKAGAATRVAMEELVRSPADGYTIGISNAIVTSFPLMFDNFPFAEGKDFVPVTMLGRVPSFLAIKSALPVRTAAEFVAYAKANSSRLNFGHAGNGSNTHIAALILQHSLGTNATAVAYKGNAQVALALGAGEVDFALLDYQTVRPMVEKGLVRLLAVTEPRRFAQLPNLPTAAEAGLTRELEGVTPWFMMVAPAGTPAAVTQLLSKHVGEIMRLPEVQQTLRSIAVEAETGTPAQASAYFNEQRDNLVRQVRAFGLSLKN